MSKHFTFRRRKRLLLNSVHILALVGFFVSFIVIAITLLDRAAEKRTFAQLQAAAAMVRNEEQCNTASTESTPVPFMSQIESGVESVDAEGGNGAEVPISHARFILDKYLDLFDQNGELFGWLRIEGTDINYPVMYSPSRPEFYLNHDFHKNKSESGVPFLDASCYEGCKNYLIHGHNMHHNGMFAPILKYENRDFWQNHTTIYFDTLYESGVYEVMAMFRSKIFEDLDDGLRYYAYTDLTDETLFNYFVDKIKIGSIYDTGVDAMFGDELLTLSTCSYHTENGRFVVVAKRIR